MVSVLRQVPEKCWQLLDVTSVLHAALVSRAWNLAVANHAAWSRTRLKAVAARLPDMITRAHLTQPRRRGHLCKVMSMGPSRPKLCNFVSGGMCVIVFRASACVQLSFSIQDVRVAWQTRRRFTSHRRPSFRRFRLWVWKTAARSRLYYSWAVRRPSVLWLTPTQAQACSCWVRINGKRL